MTYSFLMMPPTIRWIIVILGVLLFSLLFYMDHKEKKRRKMKEVTGKSNKDVD
jgi:FtsH-binding integral membrane protein